MLARLSRHVDDLARILIAVGMVVMVAAIFSQVVFRYLLGDALTWAEEAARFTFVWLVFLGSSCAFHAHAHLGITTLLTVLRGRARVVGQIVVCLMVVALLVILARYGYQLTLRTMRQTSPALGFTVGWVYAAIPTSAVVMLLHAAAQLQTYGRALIHGLEIAGPGSGEGIEP